MISINIVLVCVSTFLVQNVVAYPPKFKILAPPFICPKDKDALIHKPDNTIITFQIDAGPRVEFDWIVRWHPLVAPTQQFTLALWAAVRELELNLNDFQEDPNVFIIDNSDLLPGVNYIFNVTAKSRIDNVSIQKMIEIEYSKGDPKLLIEGQSDQFSIVLIGAELAYADIDFILEAQVTTCYRTHDYYFVWTVTSAGANVSVTDVKGYRLVLRGNTLTPGQSYDVLCQVYKHSTGDFITQNSFPFRVLNRPMRVHFNIDQLVVPVGAPFKLNSDANKLDYLRDGLTFTWVCVFGDDPVDSFYDTDNKGTLFFPWGLSYEGEYLLSLTVTVLRKRVEDQAIARVIPIKRNLPVIHMIQQPRILNEGSIATFQANISGIVPGCSIIWYFRSYHCLVSDFSSVFDICDDNPHGTRISEPINFYSLEKNFLSELTDYTNETGWKSTSASMPARAGRVRVVADCICVKEDNCTGDGEVFADVIFELNNQPEVTYSSTRAMPEYGTAMETVFRVSTRAVADSTRPIRYSFFAKLTENDTLLLGSYLEYMAIETLLPYTNGGTIVWVEVCDSLGACSSSDLVKVSVAPGEARTIEALLEDVRAHVRRCELMTLRRLAVSAIVTYTNADQAEALSKFSTSLLIALGGMEERCIENNYDEYNEFMSWLQSAGIDTNATTEDAAR